MGLSAKTSSDSNVCLKDGDELSFDSKNNANAFCSFFSNLAGNLLKKLPTPPKKIGLDSVKLYYQNLKFDNLNLTLNPATPETVLKLLQNIKAIGGGSIGQFFRFNIC